MLLLLLLWVPVLQVHYLPLPPPLLLLPLLPLWLYRWLHRWLYLLRLYLLVVVRLLVRRRLRVQRGPECVPVRLALRWVLRRLQRREPAWRRTRTRAGVAPTSARVRLAVRLCADRPQRLLRRAPVAWWRPTARLCSVGGRALLATAGVHRPELAVPRRRKQAPGPGRARGAPRRALCGRRPR